MQIHAMYRKPVGIKEHNNKKKVTNINLPVTCSQSLKCHRNIEAFQVVTLKNNILLLRSPHFRPLKKKRERKKERKKATRGLELDDPRGPLQLKPFCENKTEEKGDT